MTMSAVTPTNSAERTPLGAVAQFLNSHSKKMNTDHDMSRKPASISDISAINHISPVPSRLDLHTRRVTASHRKDL